MAKDFEIKIRGLRELRAAFRDYPKISAPILQRAIVATQFIFTKHTLKDDPVPFRTGALLQSFRYQIGFLEGRWYPTVHYAPYVEFGTRPHRIEPRSARVLAWSEGGLGRYVTAASGRQYYKQGTGSRRFAAYVNHPGTKAHPFMERIVTKSTPDVQSFFVKALDQINQQIAARTRTI